MTYYSLDTMGRQRVFFYLSALSILLCSALEYMEKFAAYKLVAPSAIVIFGFIIYLYDVYLWNLGPLKYLSGIPDLNGKWEGRLTSREANGNEEILSVEAVISQTWSRIDIVLETERTISKVDLAGFFIENKSAPVLKYSYSFKNKTGLETIKAIGEGYNELRFYLDNDKKQLKGPCFANNDRKGFLDLYYKK